ncbi:nicotianamine synthase family protein [Phytoactinopolyspora mesophila]|uniref:nicotianamine synthase family protein n=1 Tax=Phytoactinopolyspora mesophila TaxID=2650750 RepID=UPI001391C347
MTLLPAVAAPPAAGCAATTICDIYRELDSHPDLRPGPRVDELFSRLVRLVISTPDEQAADILGDPVVRGLTPRLRELCARGEFELETFWADTIAAGEDPHAELARFPYLENYQLLCRMELDAVTKAVQRPIRSMAFAGSGPLPLSSLVLAQELGITIDNLDHNPGAVDTSRRLAARLRLDNLRVHAADVAAADLSRYDVVILAALVGSSPAEKAAVLRRISVSMSPGAVLLIRSARGLRTLLYPEVDPQAIDGFEVLDVIHPSGEVINSAILARVTGTAAVPGPRNGMEH